MCMTRRSVCIDAGSSRQPRHQRVWRMSFLIPLRIIIVDALLTMPDIGQN